ncbi:MAG: tetratricopeptide repeat protein [Pyrinomonadaceae bacterium]
MPLTSRVSLLSLALSLTLMSPALAQVQSSPSAQSATEAAVRLVVEKYFALYTTKDLEGLMSLWSAKTADPAGKRKAIEKQLETSDVSINNLTISRVKIEGERATLRVTLKMEMTSKQNQQRVEERQTSNFQLVREEGMWKLWEFAPAVNDLAAALGRATLEGEQERLLVQEKDLVDSSLLAAMTELTGSLIRKSDYAQALSLSQLAARIAERIGDRRGLGDALTNLGAIHGRQQRGSQALDYLQKSLAIYEKTGDKKGMARALFEVGRTHVSQSRLDQALEYLNRSLAMSEEVRDKSSMASALNALGVIHVLQGRHQLALESYEKSRALSEELNDKVFLERALNNIGDLYIYQGRYAEALASLLKAVKINEELGSAAHKIAMATKLHNIARVYNLQGRQDQALEYNFKSLKIREEINDKEGIGGSQNNIGIIYESQGLYAQALEWLQKGMKSFEEATDKDGVAIALSNIGDIYRRQGRYDLALEHLQKSLRLHDEIGGRFGIVRTLKDLALLHRDQGKYTEMLEVSRRAARMAEELNAPEDLWKAQERIGKALRALGQPVQARQSFLEAIATIELLRQQVAGGGHQQQSFLEDKLSPWLGMIDLLVSQNRFAEALTFAERSKARVLLDVLQARRTSLRKSLSLEEQQTEEGQRLRLASLNSQLTSELRRNKPDPARVTELKAGIAKARLEYEALETSLYVAHPELKVQRGEAPIIRTEELAALLPDDTSTLLEYVVTDEVTYLFAVTKAPGKPEAEVQGFTIPIKRAQLTRQTEMFRQQLAARDLSFRASALKLYDLLLKPAQRQLKGKTNLIIVPDDKLWDLPFQALLASANRFLIEETAIAYAPSLTVQREMTKRRKNNDAASATLLALGNPLLGKETIERATLAVRDEKLDPLPEAEQEARALGQLYGAQRSKVYIGAEAREDRIKAEAGQVRVLHFATHGTLNNASPMYSHLVLAPGNKNEDGLLEAWELMQLDLKADLVVLSACETARGRFGAGEGMIGLTWALFVAGVPSTVVSQWKVESASTRDLMVSFHRGLRSPPRVGKAKATKTEALRQAALKVMNNPETSHPFYWAGFVLVGDAR